MPCPMHRRRTRRAVISKDEATKKVKITSLTPKVCFYLLYASGPDGREQFFFVGGRHDGSLRQFVRKQVCYVVERQQAQSGR